MRHGSIEISFSLQNAIFALIRPLEVSYGRQDFLLVPSQTSRYIKNTLEEHFMAICTSFTVAKECKHKTPSKWSMLVD